MAIGVDFILKASTDGFTAGVASANNAIKGVKDELKRFGGGSLAQVIGIAGIVRGFQQTLDLAQRNREEMQRLGKSIDDATRSVASYADAWDGIKSVVGRAAVVTLSFFTRAGEGWGMLINAARGYSIEQQKIMEGTAKSLADTEAAIAKAREANSPEKLAAAEAKLAEVRRRNREAELYGVEKIAALQENYNRLAAEAAALPKETVAAKEKQIEVENALFSLQKEQNKQAEEERQAIYEFDKGRPSTALSEIQSTQAVRDTTSEWADEQERVADAAAETAKSLQESAAAAEKTRFGGPLGGGTDFATASDETLQEIARRSRTEAQDIQRRNLANSTPGGNWYSLALAQSRARAAEDELDFRTQQRTNVRVFGESGARRMFTGDPLMFEEVLNKLKGNGGLGTDDKVKNAIVRIDQTLDTVLNRKR